MIEFLNETILWWHWIIFGIILLIVDMTLLHFSSLGLGAAAIIVGVVDLLVATTFTQELSIWMVLAF